MAIKTRLVSLSTVGAVLASSTVAMTSSAALSLMGGHLQDTVPVWVFNPSTQAVLLGGSAVFNSTAPGMPFVGPGYFRYDLMVSEGLFGITTAGTILVTVQACRENG